MRTALCLRYSSTRQVRGISLVDQLSRLRHDAQVGGETIIAEYIDQARTGTSAAKRPEYQRLLAAAARGEFDRVRVESVDRGHRNDQERRLFEDEMRACGVRVIYSGEPDKQAPHQRKLHRGIRGVLAEYESDETSQRTYKRQLYRARQGKWRGGPWPYGLKADGQGWFEPDPASYPVLLWIFERRAEGLGSHAIAKLLNGGIILDGGPPVVPPTPGLLTYQRKPYLEHQDPETGEVIKLHREPPAGGWFSATIRRLCSEAVSGVYAGVFVWGRRPNRFEEDSEGNPKQQVAVDTGRPLVPAALLRQVAAVEQGRAYRSHSPLNMKNTFLLSLRCGICGSALHGYTSSSSKRGRTYHYRRYRCAGRANKAGSCTMPMLNAQRLERSVVRAVLSDMTAQAPQLLLHELHEAVARYRVELVDAAETLQGRLAQAAEDREAALVAIINPRLSPALQEALAERAERAVESVTTLRASAARFRWDLISWMRRRGALLRCWATRYWSRPGGTSRRCSRRCARPCTC